MKISISSLLASRRRAKAACCRQWLTMGLLLVLLLLTASCAPAAEDMGEGLVASCFDGDTLKLTDRRVVRLAGIDSPELHQGSGPPQFYAREAWELTTSLVQGVRVRLMDVSTGSRDRYGRLVADVILPDGRSLNDILVREGAAYVYPHKNLDAHFLERLTALQGHAVRERTGMWRRLLSLSLARRPYIGNRQSLRFFAADSEWVKNIKPRNRHVFGTLMDAFIAGYAPARPCPFWPSATSRSKGRQRRHTEDQP